MLALHPRVVDLAWERVEPLLPVHRPRPHPWGCHRQRIPDWDCFWGILIRLVTGCSWDVAARLSGVSETTLRRRRDEWEAAGVFERLREEVMNTYHQVVGLDLSDVAVDGSLQKAPCGGEGTGQNPTDRRKLGWKWSICYDANGIPLGQATDGANRTDMALFEATLDSVAARGFLPEIGVLHLDRGYVEPWAQRTAAGYGLTNLVVVPRRRQGTQTPPAIPFGRRWPAERSHSWLTNFGQLRRNTDRHTHHRLSQLDLAIAMILTVKLWKHDRAKTRAA